MTSRTLLLCALVAFMAVCCSAGSGSYSSSSSSASSSSGGNIYFGDPGQAYSGSSSFSSGGPGGYDSPGLVVRSGVIDGGDSGTKGVFSSSSSKIDSDGKIHYNVQAGRF